MTDKISVVIPVYRDWTRLARLVGAVEEQALPPNVELDIVVVDDGSNDGGSSIVADNPSVTLITLAANAGRAAARNIGFEKARGRIVMFMDCDCLPGSPKLFQFHMEAIDRGAVASTGHVFGAGGGFWDRYQQRSSRRRAMQYEQGYQWTGSSQNLAVLAGAFRAVGGFDLRYRQYGFEDRDLLLRLAQTGHIAWCPEALVHHMDELHLDIVAKKLSEGARYSAPLFAHDHPTAYRTLGYGRVDAKRHPWLRVPARLLGPLAIPAARWLDPWLPGIPFRLAALLVSLISALTFLHGTAVRPPTERKD